MLATKSAVPVPVSAQAGLSKEMGAGEVAAQVAELLESSDILLAAADEPRARAIARALSAMVDGPVAFCPGSDALPGDAAPASPANVGQRVAALRQMRRALAEPKRSRIACVTTGEALGRLYPPPQAFDAAPPRVAVGEAVDLEDLFGRLLDAGYVNDERVDEPGEVALHGRVLDIWPADTLEPLRIEVADGRVEALRRYDPISQRTSDEAGAQELGRVSEPSSEEGVALVDHLPGAVLVMERGAEARRTRFLALAADAARRRPGRALRAIADPARWSRAIDKREVRMLERAADPVPRFVEEKSPLRAFNKFVREECAAGRRIVLVGSARDLRFLRSRFTRAFEAPDMVGRWAEVHAADPGSALGLEASVNRGFRLGNAVAIAAADLLGSRAERDDGPVGGTETALTGLGDVRIGDVVVHEDHGIGIVTGIAPMPASSDGSGDGGDAIALEYAAVGVRLVPVAEADRLWRYGADADAVSLDRLDGSSWQKRRGEIDAAIAETARAMTALAEERAQRTAPVLEPEAAAYERFAGGFPFSETRDQARAIDAVRADLASGKPMDRLVVGDVGYGKTEVALRAAALAALAALAGYQVALAAPTTVLARQHLGTFTERFEGSGIVVAGLSRLSTPAEKQRVKAGLAEGSVHVVIGTGAVAGAGVTYRNLGLVIVDEEQRFGAADKTRLRTLGSGHMLTLSATPIPRTLQAALAGIQRLSVIATPPARRQPIRTAVGAFDKEMVRAALLRERSRGGQSFVVVPRIEDMASVAGTLGALVPELAILQAHGKMPAVDIDDAMVRFGRGEGDVLLATNIIEAGLDVPRANTMVIWRADRFGLSQLHQLRGRVGRGSRRGQVLLLTEPERAIAPHTLKRLRTLEAFDRLGAGFAISARDLDLRGAGDLLGEAQAGHMKLIGVDLYQHLLEAALRTARGQHVERWTPELHLGIHGRLPESWIPDAEQRVTLYVRIARAVDAGAIDALEEELEDRFGALPDEAATLLSVARLRARSRDARIARIDAGPAAIALTPRHDFEATIPAGLERKGNRFLLHERIEDAPERLRRVEAVLEEMTP